jgi:hypothetical protein
MFIMFIGCKFLETAQHWFVGKKSVAKPGGVAMQLHRYPGIKCPCFMVFRIDYPGF